VEASGLGVRDHSVEQQGLREHFLSLPVETEKKWRNTRAQGFNRITPHVSHGALTDEI